MTQPTTLSNNTICAISTPAGVGGIAVARVSGAQAIEIVDKLWHGKRALAEAPTHTAHFGQIIDPLNGEMLDEAVATVFRAPRSFTGEEVVEIAVHGSLWVQRELINLLIRNGCRLAEPGEFTRRAFASGKMDLAEAEAVADVIASTSRAAHRVAISQMRGNFSRRLSQLRDSLLDLAALLELELDFSEEEVEFADRAHLLNLSNETLREVTRLANTFATGDAIRRGIPVAIIGQPNVGKSSILNLLTGDDRAIVSDIPGTTRDTVEDTVDIDGYTFRFIDTAGLRDTTDLVENLGIDRAWAKIAEARIILWVITPDTPGHEIAEFANTLAARRNPDAKTILILNKADLLPHSGDTNSSTPLTPDSSLHTFQSHVTTEKSGVTTPHTEQPADISAGAPAPTHPNCDYTLTLSALTGHGHTTLRHTLVKAATAELATAPDTTDAIIVTNARHYQALTSAADSLRRVIDALTANLPGDLVAQDVRETIHHLSAITGTITAPDILATIFSRFCIGK
ncbi:tRNA uridine-5-carboxymethylaminomethyl(34) synthesis GTPase MnmE [uncultured Muribaculum sp.]|uniref:tRNA uridine-5-carboxymethylaminomethyl(34) synthesis GTPase MnmE n=1 Tax=uncultured Muribaculum sp. TaxID=1918613 RepID=UPI002647471A|nr:tRNA uridine-5-carboxymethylaminomethyl(34) synthesis GTPase MnmE [uncultured Muribaculum sp.]